MGFSLEIENSVIGSWHGSAMEIAPGRFIAQMARKSGDPTDGKYIECRSAPPWSACLNWTAQIDL
jgi:hypothetical protein